jgi:deoxyribonuclease V
MPYIPGLLAFREAPILARAFEKLNCEPDVVLFDGHGFAHPRRMGIASHMGLLLDKPSIGCAKSRLVGTHQEPGNTPGEWSPLMDGEQQIGAVLRTRGNVKPIFVSCGHKMDLKTALMIVLQCCDGYRIPKPTREADHFVENVKRQHLSHPAGPTLFPLF